MRNEGEPALDLVEPGGVGRREVQVEARMPGEPRPHLPVLVRAVVVENEMELKLGRHLRV